MIYLPLAVACYLATGVVLTRSLQRKTPSLGMKVGIVVFGALSMPIISILSLLCATVDTIWTALLVLLGFDLEGALPARNKTATDMGVQNGQ